MELITKWHLITVELPSISNSTTLASIALNLNDWWHKSGTYNIYAHKSNFILKQQQYFIVQENLFLILINLEWLICTGVNKLHQYLGIRMIDDKRGGDLQIYTHKSNFILKQQQYFIVQGKINP